MLTSKSIGNSNNLGEKYKYNLIEGYIDGHCFFYPMRFSRIS